MSVLFSFCFLVLRGQMLKGKIEGKEIPQSRILPRPALPQSVPLLRLTVPVKGLQTDTQNHLFVVNKRDRGHADG